MGQYYNVVNLDKKQMLHPHKLGDGLKLMEFATSQYGVMTGLALLLCCSNGRGGGDFHGECPLIGSWAGDRVVIVGDYAVDTDLAPEYEASKIYGSEDYEDISDSVRYLLESTGYIKFEGDGWLRRSVYGNKIIPQMRPDVVVIA